MEHSRKQKLLVIIALVVGIASLSVGFAAFSTSLIISSQASVSANSDLFSVKFSSSKDSLVVSEIAPSNISDGITASNAIINNSTAPLITSLTATFTEPGQYVEYTFYARNEGEYNAYLNNINFSGEKSCSSMETISSNVQSACDSISMKVVVGENEYTDTTEISGHFLKKKTGEEIKIRIDYDSVGSWADANFKVSFPDIMMVYSTIDNSSFIPPTMSGGTKLLIDEVKKGAELDTNVDFSSDVHSGKYIRSGTQSEQNPVFYYRLADNNFVLFANQCWRIVRTTETGGIKLVLVGSPSESNSCENSKFRLTSNFSHFNYSDVSIADVGYMYGERIKANVESSTLYSNNTIVYGQDVTWDGQQYVISSITRSAVTSDSAFNILIKKGFMYTCGTTATSCAEVKYLYDFGYSNLITYTLSNGDMFEDVLEKAFTNTNNSLVKERIDAWYESNLLDYTSKLEDTVWCNDRRLALDLRLARYAFKPYSRLGFYPDSIAQPSFECDENDSFTKDKSNGNGALIYPIGLLTADESYLFGYPIATMSPIYFTDYGGKSSVNAGTFGFFSKNIGNVYANYSFSPAISLLPDTRVVSGDGTAASPYVIE